MPDEETADRLGEQLVRLVKLANHAKQQIHQGGGPVDGAGYALLGMLAATGPQRATHLADRVRSDPSTVSRQIAQLVAQGLVERRVDPADGRASLLAPTAEGERVCAARRQARAAKIAEIIADWPADDSAELVRLLTRLTTDIENHTRDKTHQGDPA